MFYLLNETFTKFASDTNNVYTMDGTGYSTTKASEGYFRKKYRERLEKLLVEKEFRVLQLIVQ